MLNKISVQMIEPKIVVDLNAITGGVRVEYSDETHKDILLSGGGGGNSPIITMNGGQTASVQPSANVAVRVQNVAASTNITWTGTGSSVSDPFIASLNSAVGSSSGTDFTTQVPVGSQARAITFSATIGGQVIASFTVTVSSSAQDFQITQPAALNFTAGQSTPVQLAVTMTGVVGAIGNVVVTPTAGSGPLTFQPTTLTLTASTLTGNIAVTLGSSAVAGQTYPITLTATNGTVTKTVTVNAVVATGGAFQAPVLTFLTESGLPSNEISINAAIGFRITNVYAGSGAQLILKGWDTGPSNPSGSDLDVTALLSNPSYYNATTKVFEFNGLVIGTSLMESLKCFFTSSGAPDRTIAQGTFPFQASMKAPAPDGQTRTSNTVNVSVKRGINFNGSPMNSANNVISIIGGIGGTFYFNIYAPKYAGQAAEFAWSLTAYTTPIAMGNLDGSGVLNATFPNDPLFPDYLYTAQGSWGQMKHYITAGGQKITLGAIPIVTNPNGASGSPDVPPPLTFFRRNSGAPIDMQFMTGSGTPMTQVAIGGSFGSNTDANVRSDLNLRVQLSAIGSSFQLQLRNMGIQISNNQGRYLMSGFGLAVSDTSSFNEYATGGDSSSGDIYYGVRTSAYAGSDVTFTLPAGPISAALANAAFSSELAMSFAICGQDGGNGQIYVFRHVNITVVKD